MYDLSDRNSTNNVMFYYNIRLSKIVVICCGAIVVVRLQA